MFKIYISDALYNDVVRAEEQKNFSECSDLYKMLKRQPVQSPVEAQTIQTSGGVNGKHMDYSEAFGLCLTLNYFCAH